VHHGVSHRRRALRICGTATSHPDQYFPKSRWILRDRDDAYAVSLRPVQCSLPSRDIANHGPVTVLVFASNYTPHCGQTCGYAGWQASVGTGGRFQSESAAEFIGIRMVDCAQARFRWPPVRFAGRGVRGSTMPVGAKPEGDEELPCDGVPRSRQPSWWAAGVSPALFQRLFVHAGACS
jgi:hypothetical protein